MSNPSPIEPQAKRPEAPRHGSDWLSRLHRRHDAKHHSSHQRDQEEAAPLLAQPDDYPTGEHVNAADEAAAEPRGRLDALKEAGQRGASTITQATQIVVEAAVNGSNALARSTASVSKTTARKTREHARKVMGTIILLLLIALAVLGSLFGVHLAMDRMNQACTDLSCISAAANILQNLGAAVGAQSSSIDSIAQAISPDPCTNFDELVCGGFSENTYLRDDQGEVDAGTIVAAKAERLLRETAEKPSSAMSAQDTLLHMLLKDDYTACMAQHEVAKKGLEPLKNETNKIKDLMGQHDPVQPRPGPSRQVFTSAHDVGVNSLTDTIAHLTQIRVPALVDFRVGIDDTSPSEHAIFASPVPAFWALGLSSVKHHQDMSIVAEYRKVAKDVLRNFFDERVNTTRILHLAPRDVSRLSANLDLAQVIIDFEVKLAMITPAREAMVDPMQSYNKLNVSEFEALLPEISLPRLVKTLAPPDYMADSIIVSSPVYLSKLRFLLQMTKTEVLQGFFVWKTIQQYADRIEHPALNPLKDFNARIKGSRIDAPAERWRQCVQDANDDLPWISALFSLQNTKPDLEMSTAIDIANKVRNAFSNILKNVKWMAADDGEQSAKKIQATKQEIGQPENLRALSFESYYSGLAIRDDTYFGNKISAATFQTTKTWAKLGKTTDLKEWDVTPLSTQPQYDVNLNRLLLPEALLHSPISYRALPDYALFGSFGAITGHGLSEAVGPVGSYYAKNGTLADLWSEATREAFNIKAQCLSDQYSSFAVQGPDGSDYQVNGKLTLAANMADVAGANAAYAAWKEYEKTHLNGPTLPGLEKFTRDQVFWLAFGNTLCSITTTEMAVQEVRSSPQAPARARILGTVANSRGFLKAFKCPTKQPKCDLF